MTALLLHSFTNKAGCLASGEVRTHCDRVKVRSRQWVKLMGMVISLLLLLGCRDAEVPSGSWKTYHNPRYSFEFPYPSQWLAAPPPDNQDGQVFHDPKNSKAEIRAWAGHQIKTGAQQKSIAPLKPNFTTEQGLAGELKVNIGPQTSSMTLVLQQGDLRYNWQARSPSQDFDDYYRFFYYIAQHYRVPPPSQQP